MKGDMTSMLNMGDRVDIEFDIPSRGIIGLRTNVLTASQGEAIMAHRFKEAVAWLNRTGNMMLHGTTCKVPYDEWCKECKDLHPYYPVAARKQEDGHQVMKTNSVKYHGNIYSVPLGTYRDDTSRVLLVESNGDLIISTMDGKEIARHIIPSGRGKGFRLGLAFHLISS